MTRYRTLPREVEAVPYGPEHPDYPNAPRDWDQGPYMCRDGQWYHMSGYGWKHGLYCSNPTSDWDRISYHRIVNAADFDEQFEEIGDE